MRLFVKKNIVRSVVLPALILSFVSLMPMNANAADNDSVGVYRLYNGESGEFLYTTDVNEVTSLSSSGWGNQDVCWNAPLTGIAVYRLFNPSTGIHLFTSDSNEINVLTSEHGWRIDKNNTPMFYSGGSHNINRFYNKTGGYHFLTGSSAECEKYSKPDMGWVSEGVAFNALSVPGSGTTNANSATTSNPATNNNPVANNNSTTTINTAGEIRPHIKTAVAEYVIAVNRYNVVYETNINIANRNLDIMEKTVLSFSSTAKRSYDRAKKGYEDAMSKIDSAQNEYKTLYNNLVAMIPNMTPAEYQYYIDTTKDVKVK